MIIHLYMIVLAETLQKHAKKIQCVLRPLVLILLFNWVKLSFQLS